MKNLKKIFSSIFLVALAIFITNTTSIEPAEAYYGNWKSQTQTCQIRKIIRVTDSFGSGSSSETISDTGFVEGSMRRCVDGSGLCFWGSSCSAN